MAIEWELRAREEEEKLASGSVFQDASVGLDAERDGDWSLGPAVSAPLPIFDTGRARKERARALSAEERHRLTQAQRTVIEDVRTSLAALLGAQENLARVDQELLPLQTQRRGEIEEAYRQGFVDVTALLFADQALQETQARRVDLARELALAQSRLERSIGGPALFGALIDTGSRVSVMWGYVFGAALMVIAAVVEALIGINSERRPLEEVARPLSCCD